MKDYLSINFLEREIKRSKMRIYMGLLKYGYANFSLQRPPLSFFFLFFLLFVYY
jgi:hypothetical protein